MEKETAIEKKTPDHDCESIGGKVEEVVSYFRNSSVLNDRCSSWKRFFWNFWWLSTSHQHIQKNKLLRAVRQNINRRCVLKRQPRWPPVWSAGSFYLLHFTNQLKRWKWRYSNFRRWKTEQLQIFLQFVIDLWKNWSFTKVFLNCNDP